MDSLTPISAHTGKLYAEQARQLAQSQSANEDIIYEKAKELEGTFLSAMIEPMFSKDSSTGLFGGGGANDIFRSMMVNEYGQVLSQSGGIGLADDIAREMLALQEAGQ